MFMIIERVWDYEAAGMLKYADWYNAGEYDLFDEAYAHMPRWHVDEVPTSDGESIGLLHDFFVVDTETGIIKATTADDEEPEDEYTKRRIRRGLGLPDPQEDEDTEDWSVALIEDD